jgi:hypothetical protein
MHGEEEDEQEEKEVAGGSKKVKGLRAAALAGGHELHGQRVVSAALAAGGDEALHALIARFRAAFVDACRPRYLHPSWEVNHRTPREFGVHSVFSAHPLPPQPVVPIVGVASDGDGDDRGSTTGGGDD